MHTLLCDGNKEIAEALVPQRLAVAAELHQRMPGYGVLALAEPFMVRDLVADCTVRSLRAALEQPADQLAEPVASAPQPRARRSTRTKNAAPYSQSSRKTSPQA